MFLSSTVWRLARHEARVAVSRAGTLQPSPILAEQLVKVERVEAAVALLHGVRL